MPSHNALGELIVALISIPFVLARDLVRFLLWLNRWRARRAMLPPLLLNRSRAVGATFVLAFIASLVPWLPLLAGRSINALLADFLRTPAAPPPELIALAATAALALLFLIVGLRGVRGAPPDAVATVISLALAAGSTTLWWREWYLPAAFGDVAHYGNPLLQALYIGMLAAALMRACLSAPSPFASNALRTINRQLKQRNAPLVAARRRRFFLW